MHIPDLPPDLRFPILPQDEDALRYSFEAKRAAMGPYIMAHWGWDEALQLRLTASGSPRSRSPGSCGAARMPARFR